MKKQSLTLVFAGSIMVALALFALVFAFATFLMHT